MKLDKIIIKLNSYGQKKKEICDTNFLKKRLFSLLFFKKINISILPLMAQT